MSGLVEWMTKNPALGSALVAAVTSVGVALLTNFLQPFGQRKIETLKGLVQKELADERSKAEQSLAVTKASLDDSNSAAAARRAYEYEARKRLYAEVEPILFQLHEALEEAHWRVRSLARSERDGKLEPDGDDWLGGVGYYFKSTLYKLMVPAVHFRLLQRCVTFFDLTLDSSISLRYQLMKLYARSYTDDFDFAKLPPTLAYGPNDRDAKEKRLSNGARYQRQGLYVGEVEAIADAMIVEENGKRRVMQFAEFDAKLTNGAPDPALTQVLHWLLDYSSTRKPVLARLLHAQACLARLILSTYYGETKLEALKGRLAKLLEDKGLSHELAWTQGAPAALAGPIAYLTERLKWLGTDASMVEKGSGEGGVTGGSRETPKASSVAV